MTEEVSKSRPRRCCWGWRWGSAGVWGEVELGELCCEEGVALEELEEGWGRWEWGMWWLRKRLRSWRGPCFGAEVAGEGGFGERARWGVWKEMRRRKRERDGGEGSESCEQVSGRRGGGWGLTWFWRGVGIGMGIGEEAEEGE